MVSSAILKREEKAVYALRSLYRSYGYLPYKMSKFEEYEYYIRNKDFLVSDRIITFNDTNGSLMALKPDVTLSIIKGSAPQPGCKKKVCYNENIYRVSDRTHQYKEIMQTGLECIGDIGLYDIFETVTLAAQSLALIGGEYVLQISHLGVLSQALQSICEDKNFQQEALRCIAGKNAHDLYRACHRWQVPEAADTLCTFIRAYGPRDQVLAMLEKANCQGLQELRQLSQLLDRTPYGAHITFDFSVVNNMSYYNGIVFRGFLNGIHEGILAGGQYDKLMHKLGHSCGAIGFAVYLDLLEQLPRERQECDVDVLLLCGDADPAAICETVSRLVAEGKTVSVQSAIPEKLRYRQLLTLGKEGAPC